jgi:8-oxo-dGTP diphosphatase
VGLVGDPNQPLTPEQTAHVASLPAKRMGSGALIRDPAGRVLLVEPTYKATWEVPGGNVDRDESPRTACARELREELGLDLPVGRLLVVEWQGPEPDRAESVLHVYDGGTLDSLDDVRLPPDELASCRFVAEPDLDAVLATRLARRVRAALTALAEGVVVELDHGVRVDL